MVIVKVNKVDLMSESEVETSEIFSVVMLGKKVREDVCEGVVSIKRAALV